MTSSATRREKKARENLQRKADSETPVLDLGFTPQGLLNPGPIINTGIGVTESHAQALVKAGLPVPKPLTCRFLIDTGAHGCVVKHDIADSAGLKLISTGIPIQGVGIDTTGRIYMGRIWFGIPSKKAPGVQHQIGMDVQIASGTLNDSQILDGIIGRDVLANIEFHYNGRTGRVTLRFLRP